MNQLYLNADHHPYAGQLPELREKYDSHTRIGSSIRRRDAEMRIAEMESVEVTVQRMECYAERLRHRISQMNALHRLNMDYLMRFGVTADCRNQFRDVLSGVRVHGALTLKEAAAVARAIGIHQKENGDSSSESTSVEDPF